MKKRIGLIIAVCLIAIIISGCLNGTLSSGNSVISSVESEQHKTTPEEAISKYMQDKEINPQTPYAYLLIDKYIFLLYGNGTAGGYENEEDGYRMSLPWGFKFQSYIPDVPPNIIDYVGVVKNDNDYQIELHGYKFVGGESIVENDMVKVFDTTGKDLKKLYVDSEESEVCVWITVLNELPDDYKITLEYRGDTYTVIDAKTIKELVG